MKLKNRTRLLNVLFITAAITYSGLSNAASGSFETSVAVDGTAIVDVTNASGNVTVRGADVDEVTIRARITISKRLQKTDPLKVGNIIAQIKRSPPITSDGNRVTVQALQKSTHKRYASISYEILVPRNAEVNVQSISGNIHVSGVTGRVTANSESGEVTMPG